jgi:hypothetical protein
MNGQWPPEWDDPEWEDSETGLPDERAAADAGLDLEASAVTLFLASVPSPVLPASFEARISAAIAAEAAARADGKVPAATASAQERPVDPALAQAVDAALDATGSAHAGTAAAGTDEAKTTARSSSPDSSPMAAESGTATSAPHRRRRTSAASGGARRSGPGGSRPKGRRRRLRMPSAAVTAPLIVLIFIGFVIALTQLGGSSPTYSGTEGLGAASASAPAASAASGRTSGHGSAPSDRGLNNTFDGASPFVITESGTRYEAATLATQVQTQLSDQNAVLPAASSVPSASSSASAAASAPGVYGAQSGTSATALVGCVGRLTKDTTPSLVDRASYDGTPAYIIAVPTHVWVVGLNCSARDLHEITSASLTGLVGNLSALGSVKGNASPEERRMQ